MLSFQKQNKKLADAYVQGTFPKVIHRVDLESLIVIYAKLMNNGKICIATPSPDNSKF